MPIYNLMNKLILVLFSLSKTVFNIMLAFYITFLHQNFSLFRNKRPVVKYI